jgi:NhaP-type Na+/H+ or K+/H+ antiporter
LGNLFYVKTKIPDVIWLLLFGFIIGPVFKLYDPEPFIRASPFMSIIALCIILFDAGINMDLDTFIKVPEAYF